MLRKTLFLSATLLALTTPIAAQEGLRFIKPAGGESYHQGESITIKFVVDRELIKSDKSMVLSICFDNGLQYFSIVSEFKWTDAAYFSGDTGTVTWTIPDSMSVVEYRDTITSSTLANASALCMLEAPYGSIHYSVPTLPFTILEADSQPSTPQPSATSPTDGCGRGVSAALLPLVVLKFFRRKKSVEIKK